MNKQVYRILEIPVHTLASDSLTFTSQNIIKLMHWRNDFNLTVVYKL